LICLISFFGLHAIRVDGSRTRNFARAFLCCCSGDFICIEFEIRTKLSTKKAKARQVFITQYGSEHEKSSSELADQLRKSIPKRLCAKYFSLNPDKLIAELP